MPCQTRPNTETNRHRFMPMQTSDQVRSDLSLRFMSTGMLARSLAPRTLPLTGSGILCCSAKIELPRMHRGTASRLPPYSQNVESSLRSLHFADEFSETARHQMVAHLAAQTLLEPNARDAGSF